MSDDSLFREPHPNTLYSLSAKYPTCQFFFFFYKLGAELVLYWAGVLAKLKIDSKSAS